MLTIKKNTFKNEAAGNYLNTNFINIVVDGETQEVQELIRKYKIRSYLSLLIDSSNGEVKIRKVGFPSPYILINYVEKIKSEMLNPFLCLFFERDFLYLGVP
jgi:hypothetical protein